MRIAFVHELWKAGAGRCVADLVAALSERHDVLLVPDEEHCTRHAIWNRLRNFRPDVVHCHSFYGNQALPYEDLVDLARLAPTVFTVHDPRPIGTMNPVCWNCTHNRTCRSCPLSTRWRRVLPAFSTYYRARLRKRWTHRRCAPNLRLVAPSRWMQQRLAASELSRFAIHQVYNGVDVTRFRPGIAPHAFRNQLPPGALVILHAAHTGGMYLDARKGLTETWEAFFSTVLPRFPAARLAIAGEGVVPNHPAVIPLGLIDSAAMPAVYAAADIYVSATHADNLPYTVLEAMACGVPVVAAAVGGIPELVTMGLTGSLFSSRDPIAIATAILPFMGDAHLRRTCAAAAAEKARSCFTIDQMVNAYMNLFLTAWNSRNRSAAPG